jgi:myo-inositol-1(or 4)-monophosphatase
MPAAAFDAADPVTLEPLRMLAEGAARVGGQVARQYFGTGMEVWLKADRSEVSRADEAAQAAVIAHLRAARPDDAFVAEEQLTLSPPPPPPPSADRLCWVIDPIDGTRNFIRGIPLYACSVAAMIGGHSVAGAVYDAPRDMLYSAARGGGLLIDGRLQLARAGGAVRARGVNPKPVVAIPSSPTALTAANAHAWLDRFVCRGLGCTALHMAWVASGELEAMLADNPRLWDIAAGALLIAEAGGRVTSITGTPLFPFDVARYGGEPLPTIASADADRHATFLAL